MNFYFIPILIVLTQLNFITSQRSDDIQSRHSRPSSRDQDRCVRGQRCRIPSKEPDDEGYKSDKDRPAVLSRDDWPATPSGGRPGIGTDYKPPKETGHDRKDDAVDEKQEKSGTPVPEKDEYHAKPVVADDYEVKPVVEHKPKTVDRDDYDVKPDREAYKPKSPDDKDYSPPKPVDRVSYVPKSVITVQQKPKPVIIEDYKPVSSNDSTDRSYPRHVTWDEYNSRPGVSRDDRPKVVDERDEQKSRPVGREDHKPKEDSDRDDYKPRPVAGRDEYKPRPISDRDEYKPKPVTDRDDYKPRPVGGSDDYKPKPDSVRDDYIPRPVGGRDDYKPKPDSVRDDYNPRPVGGRDEYKPKPISDRDEYKPKPDSDRDDYIPRPVGGRDEYKPKPDSDRDDYNPRPVGGSDEYKPKPDSDRDDYNPRPVGGRDEYKPKPVSNRDDYNPRPTAVRDEYKPKPDSDRDDYNPRPVAGRDEYKPKPDSDRDDYNPRPVGGRDEYKPKPKPDSDRDDYNPRPVGGRDEYKPKPVRDRDDYDPKPVGGADDYRPRPVDVRDDYKLKPGESKDDNSPRPVRRRDDYNPRPVGGRDEYNPKPVSDRDDYNPRPVGGRDDYKPDGSRDDYNPRPVGGRDDYKPKPIRDRDEYDRKPQVSGGGGGRPRPVGTGQSEKHDLGGYEEAKDDDYNDDKSIDEDYKEDVYGNVGQPQPVFEDKNCICVPYYQCQDGHIVTDGGGIIDARKRPQPDEDIPLDGKFNPPSCGPFHVCCNTPQSSTVKPYEHRCGVRNPSGINSRILSPSNKGEADFGEWPWQAAVLKSEGKVNIFQCGGVLIDKYHVLTVAHCVYHLYKYNEYPLKVRLGEWDTQTTTEFLSHEDYKVSKISIHPEYRNSSLWNDLAILKLEEAVLFAPHIDTVCLPQYDEIFAGQNCVVTGWGKDAYKGGTFSNVMKEVALQVIDSYKCEELLRKTRLGRFFQLHEGFICAGGEHGLDSCKGDGGGPLVCYRKDKSYALAGIVSWGIDCGQPGVPGVYVKMQKFLDWISQTTDVNLQDYWPRY